MHLAFWCVHAGSSADPPTLTIVVATSEEIELQCTSNCSTSIEWNRGNSSADYISNLQISSSNLSMDERKFISSIHTMNQNTSNCSGDMGTAIYTIAFNLTRLTLNTTLPNISCVLPSGVPSQLVNLMELFKSVKESKNC